MSTASCTGKIRFDTYGLAATAARRKRRNSDRPMKPYHCRDCDGFHIGTNARTPADLERRYFKSRQKHRAAVPLIDDDPFNNW